MYRLVISSILFGLPRLFYAQTTCIPPDNPSRVEMAEHYLIYGGQTNAISLSNTTLISVGQAVTGTAISGQYSTIGGIWSILQKEPLQPSVTASKGAFNDRITLSWSMPALSSTPSRGFKIRRDGAFLAELQLGTTQFIDFNVQPGERYNYQIAGFNGFGTGSFGTDIGFVNPNGVVSGQIQTISGTPVVDAQVRLTPNTNKSLRFDGSSSEACFDHSAEWLSDTMTISLWVKINDGNNSSTILDMGSQVDKNFWLKTTASNQSKGIVLQVGGQSGYISYEWMDNPNGWHYIALTYKNGDWTLLVDNIFAGHVTAPITYDAQSMTLGHSKVGNSYFNGWLDELKFFNRSLPISEITMLQNTSVSGSYDGITGYWKFNEGIGEKTFDFSRQNKDGKLTATNFSSDAPNVYNAANTDEGGFYIIEGVDYSAQQSFTVTPNKNFYKDYALEFDGSNGDYLQFPTSVEMTRSGTMQILFYPFIGSKEQVIVHGAGLGGQFKLKILNSELYLSVNGEEQVLGPVQSAYMPVVLGMDTLNNQVAYYLNGNLVKQLTYGNLSNWGKADKWYLGNQDLNLSPYPFTGIVDEWAIFDTVIPLNSIQLYSSKLTDGSQILDDARLKHYFSFSNGPLGSIRDLGYGMAEGGIISNLDYTTLTYRQTTTPHLFTPSKKVVNINSSSTAVGNVDFRDVSTINVTGVVRYSDTYCYAEQIDILVNGQANLPPVSTNNEGKWTVDFDPGFSGNLQPSFKDHQFLPAFYELKQISQPVAGVLFQDVTKRKITGQIAGGDCRQSIIPSGAVVKIKAKALNGCFEKEITITNQTGQYTIDNLPPLKFSVVVTEHSNPVIKDYFQLQGGVEVDLTDQTSDTIDFIYYAPPEVEITDFLANACGYKIIRQGQSYTQRVRVFERYDGGLCYLDTATLIIDNALADLNQYEVSMDSGRYDLTFTAGLPFISPPYEKSLQVTASSKGNTGSSIVKAVILGKRARTATFQSKSPQIPFLVLRDPPGDGSYAYVAANSTVCNTLDFSVSTGGASENKLKMALGATEEFSTGIGVAKTTKIEVKATKELSLELKYNAGYGTSAEYCLTTNKKYQTSAIDDFPGPSQDIFVGSAINFKYGLTDDLVFDDTTCSFSLENTVTILPKEFVTEFLYSRYQIENNVIPDLLMLGDTTSANSWKSILADEENYKKNAVFKNNLSFNGGTVYEESRTTSRKNTTTFSFNTEFNAAMEETFGVEVNDAGITSGIKTSFSFGSSVQSSEAQTNERTVGFVLYDQHILDNFTVDVKEDGHYGTPVFSLISGQSMCPWETGTQNRQQLDLTIDRRFAENIPSKGEAVFQLTLANNSPAGQSQSYILAQPTGRNPDGAEVNILGGSQFNRPIQIPAFGSKQFTLSVKRGPTAYKYNNLAIAAYAQCEYEFAQDYGIDITVYDTVQFDQNPFYQEELFDVAFLEPCSEVDIAIPSNNVITPSDGNVFFLTLNSYNKADTDLDSIRVQYRKKSGDGAWINIKEIPKSDLGAVFEMVEWDTEDLEDALYEVRAITQCASLALTPGVSSIIPIRIERNGPELLGTPQPADGVLIPGDAITVQFTKRIDCNNIFQADGIGTNINNNNVGLYDAGTNTLIDAIISCNDDQLVIVPNVENKFIENRTLRVRVEAIKDLVGNTLLNPIVWEFFVNRSNLYWEGGGLDEIVEENNALQVQRIIRNQGGTTMDFTVEDIPEWVTLSQYGGSIAPGEFVTLTFNFGNDLATGIYEATINLVTAEGTEPLNIKLRVTCPSPAWDFDPVDYSYSMNLVLKLNVEGTLSKDPLDEVAGFINGELRGSAQAKYIKSLDDYYVFLTLYSDSITLDQDIEFKIWDASNCELYVDLLDVLPFRADEVLGTTTAPQIINTNNRVVRSRSIKRGWNWISYNVYMSDYSPERVLSSLTVANNALIKGQTGFAQFSAANNDWIGSLNALDPSKMYQYRSDGLDTFTVVGRPINTNTDSISLTQGWNWIGFYPQQGMTINDGLASLSPTNGDVIKSQIGFAQYIAGAGWVGNLNFFKPMEGYQIRLSAADYLKFPASRFDFPSTERIIDFRSDPSNQFAINPAQYEYVMNLIGELKNDQNQGSFVPEDHDQVLALHGDSIIGIGTLVWVAAVDAYRIFINMYSNNTYEDEIQFEWYDASEDQRIPLNERLVFESDALLGSIAHPFPFSFGQLNPVQEHGADQVSFTDSMEVWPNPAKGRFQIAYYLAKAAVPSRVMVMDILGTIQYEQSLSLVPGWNRFELEISDWPSGIYYIAVQSKHGRSIKTLQVINK